MTQTHPEFVKALQQFVADYNHENGTDIQFRLDKSELSRGLKAQFFTKRNRWIANMANEAKSCPHGYHLYLPRNRVDRCRIS